MNKIPEDFYTSRDCNFDNISQEEYLGLTNRYDADYAKLRHETESLGEPGTLDDVHTEAAIIEKQKFANGHELCILSIRELHKAYPGVKIKMMKIQNGDHVYLILNEQIFFDPWSRTIMPETYTPLNFRAVVLFRFPDDLKATFGKTMIHAPVVAPMNGEQKAVVYVNV